MPLAAAQRVAATPHGSDQLFRILVQGVVDYAIYMLDPEGRITNWNPGGERIKGYSGHDVIGQHFSMFYTEEDRAHGEPARTLGTALREGRFEGEGWRVRKDGSRFWASVVVDRILDEDGKLLGFAKITRDMSEKRKAAEELERARAALAQSQKLEAIGQLTGGIAHDFNNLLTVIANALDLLSDHRRDEAQRRRIIDFAQRATERGAKLTQHLLAYARRQPLRPAVHDINDLIRGFEAVLRRACPETVDFALPLAAGRLSAKIDAPQFETALLNLVVNARDAMAKGGKVTITTGVETIDETHAVLMSNIVPGEYVTVATADTGEGMQPEVLARAFEPFFTTKEVGKGSGLGLSQVYGFVTQSGGHVELSSAPGRGTTVTLYLPAVASLPAETGKTAGQSSAGVGRILVVEDDPEVLDVTVETLRRIGYDVLTAGDAPSALAVLRREAEIDVLFNGVELARAALRLRPQLRVLLASGYPMSVLSGRRGIAVDTGFAFISKPYRGADLAEALRSLETASRASA
jgi:PAS domain S-box-containing protein